MFIFPENGRFFQTKDVKIPGGVRSAPVFFLFFALQAAIPAYNCIHKFRWIRIPAHPCRIKQEGAQPMLEISQKTNLLE
ncbi:MAG: hypothetical protein IJJ60_12755, partial [Clostridia bacterium]|nr:hypothetical protein [Clostridia bacterium]